MLNKKNRLTKDKDFERVFNNGRAFHLKELGIRCIENNMDVCRFGFLVSTKISKSAVKRNKLKRQLSEIIRLNLDKIKPGYDCVVITRPGILDKNHEELETALKTIFKKLRML